VVENWLFFASFFNTGFIYDIYHSFFFDYFDADYDVVAANQSSMLHQSDSIQDLKEDPNQVGNDYSNLHSIDPIRMRSLACFNALLGTCKLGANCSNSHDTGVS
jgi:hypothetical protein